MLTVLVSVLSNAANILLDKLILSKRKLGVKQYIPLLFVFLFVITFITVPWLGAVNVDLATNQTYIFYFILMIMLAIVWNIFYYQGLQKEKIIEFEMILLFTPLVTILFAALFFPEEFHPTVFWSAVVASLALILSHLKKHHLDFNKYAIHLLLAVVLMAMEAMVQKELLYIYSPVSLYAFRTGVLALFFTIYYRPIVAKINDGDFRLVFATAALGALHMITKFYGFRELGVTLTTLLLLLSPIITSWVGVKINGDKIDRRTVVAFVIILLCVAFAISEQHL